MTTLLAVAFGFEQKQLLAACWSSTAIAELGNPIYFKQFELQIDVEAKRMFFLVEGLKASWILFSR